jgi:YhcH/YjgK/YiaL family protein
MILDVMDHARRYEALNAGFAKAFAFLSRPDIKALPVGKYDIDGERVFATVSKGPGRRKGEARLEAHQKYVDIQFVLAGVEEMGWKPRALCVRPAGNYVPESDIQFFDDDVDTWFLVNPGAFAVFFPEDAHLPLIAAGEIHKVVVKVAAVDAGGSAGAFRPD